jgi:hypothetical protein
MRRFTCEVHSTEYNDYRTSAPSSLVDILMSRETEYLGIAIHGVSARRGDVYVARNSVGGDSKILYDDGDNSSLLTWLEI